MVRQQPELLDVALGDLPPDASVDLRFHGLFDLFDRGQTVPWDYWIKLDRVETDGGFTGAIDVSAYNAVDFPIAADWSGQALTDSSGSVDLRLLFRECRERSGRGGQGCLVLPDSYLVAKVANTAPWEGAPACQ